MNRKCLRKKYYYIHQIMLGYCIVYVVCINIFLLRSLFNIFILAFLNNVWPTQSSCIIKIKRLSLRATTKYDMLSTHSTRRLTLKNCINSLNLVDTKLFHETEWKIYF